MAKIIEFIFVNFLFLMFIFAMFFAYMNASHLKKTKDKLDIYIRNLGLFCIGIEGIYAFVFHVIFPQTSAYIGWANSPFQYEIGIADLAIGVAGIMMYLKRHDFSFWLSTTVINSVFFIGAAIGHIRDMVEKGNFSPDNAGTILWTETLVALLIPYLLWKYKKSR